MIIPHKNQSNGISALWSLVFILLLGACGSAKSTGEISYTKEQKFDKAFFEALHYKVKGDDENALKYFEQALKINPNSDAVYFEISKISRKKGEYAEAIEQANKAISLRSEYNHWYKLHLAELYNVLGRYKESAAVYKSMYRAEQDDEQLYIEAANQLVLAKEYQEALSVLDELDENLGISQNSAWGRRYIYLTLDDKDNAIKAIEDLVKAYPEEARYKVFLAETHVNFKEYQEAIDILESIKAKGEEKGQAWLLLAELYQRINNWDKAFNSMKEAFSYSEIELEQKFQTFSPYFLKIKTSDTARAQALILSDIILEAHPGEDRPLVLKSDIYKILDSLETARNYLLEAIEINSSDYRTWNKLLELDTRIKNPDYQIQDAQNAIELFPTVPSLYLTKAYGHFDKQDYEGALDAVESGLEIAIEEFDQVDLFACKASVLDAMGDHELSDLAFDKALSIKPNDILIMNNYAYALAERGERLEFADSLINIALSAQASNPYYLDTKAWILFKQGKYEEAKRLLERAIILDSKSPEYFEHLAEIAIAEGDNDAAKSHYKTSVELGGDNRELGEKIKSLN
ncbi:tetratricopeptide repeat protein [bacterium]|nr:tetratricopeptide repeat protein [bacterium]